MERLGHGAEARAPSSDTTAFGACMSAAHGPSSHAKATSICSTRRANGKALRRSCFAYSDMLASLGIYAFCAAACRAVQHAFSAHIGRLLFGTACRSGPAKPDFRRCTRTFLDQLPIALMPPLLRASRFSCGAFSARVVSRMWPCDLVTQLAEAGVRKAILNAP